MFSIVFTQYLSILSLQKIFNDDIDIKNTPLGTIMLLGLPEVKVSSIFKIIIVSIISSFLIYLGMVFFIIPGIILTYSYSQIIYLCIDKKYSELSVFEVLRSSRLLMQGHKLQYFILLLTFIGWQFLVMITFGLASFFVLPYMEITKYLYFEELKD